MDEMYKGMVGSPITYLTGDISAGQTTIAIADDTALPDAPNICTIGYGENIETIRYGDKSNGVLQNVTRGIEGTPRAWQAGTEVARFFTAYDHLAMIDKITENANNLATHQAENVTDTGGAHGLEYEEGTFTPVVRGSTTAGSATYSERVGKYIRVGKLVFITISVSWSGHTGTGELIIGDLPFTPIQTYYQPISVTADDLSFSNHLVARFTPGIKEIALRGITNNGKAVAIQMDSQASLYLGGSYIAQ